MNRAFGLTVLCLAFLALLWAGCPRDSGEGDQVLPRVGDGPGGSAPGTGTTAPPVDVSGAPESMVRDVDPFFVLVDPTPVKSALAKKAEVEARAAKLLLGTAREQEAAHKALTALPLASAFFLLPAVKALSQEKSLDPYDSEDKAMEVIFEIQTAYLRGKDMKALLRYFSAVTGKRLLVEKKILEVARAFDIRPVYPLPALSRVGDHLKLEDELWKAIDRDADTIELSYRVRYNLRIHGEEISWLLPALANVEKVQVRLDPEVKGPVTLRVRSNDCAEAIRQIAEHAGFRVQQSGSVLWVKSK